MRSLSVEQQVYLAISYKGASLSAVARKMGMTQQNLHRKITHNTLRKEDLCKIGKILGGDYVSYFSFPDGNLDSPESRRLAPGDVIIGYSKMAARPRRH